MNAAARNRQMKEIQTSWDHFEWLLEEKLVSIDNNIRKMVSELQAMDVPEWMILEFLPEQFERLRKRIVEEQNLRYAKERKDGLEN